MVLDRSTEKHNQTVARDLYCLSSNVGILKVIWDVKVFIQATHTNVKKVWNLIDRFLCYLSIVLSRVARIIVNQGFVVKKTHGFGISDKWDKSTNIYSVSPIIIPNQKRPDICSSTVQLLALKFEYLPISSYRPLLFKETNIA